MQHVLTLGLPLKAESENGKKKAFFLSFIFLIQYLLPLPPFHKVTRCSPYRQHIKADAQSLLKLQPARNHHKIS